GVGRVQVGHVDGAADQGVVGNAAGERAHVAQGEPVRALHRRPAELARVELRAQARPQLRKAGKIADAADAELRGARGAYAKGVGVVEAQWRGNQVAPRRGRPRHRGKIGEVRPVQDVVREHAGVLGKDVDAPRVERGQGDAGAAEVRRALDA